MTEWEWENGQVLKGSGLEVKKGFIIKRKFVDELKFKIKGRLSPGSKGSETAKDIFYFKLGVEEIQTKHLPVSIVEIVSNVLWEINIDHIKTVQMNREGLDNNEILRDMAKRVAGGEQVKNFYLKVIGKDQMAEFNLDIKKKKDVRGEIEFKNPVGKRDVDRLTRDLRELLPLFKKEEKKGKRKEKDKEDDGPPVRTGPGYEVVPGYYVTGSGRV